MSKGMVLRTIENYAVLDGAKPKTRFMALKGPVNYPLPPRLSLDDVESSEDESHKARKSARESRMLRGAQTALIDPLEQSGPRASRAAGGLFDGGSSARRRSTGDMVVWKICVPFVVPFGSDIGFGSHVHWVFGLIMVTEFRREYPCPGPVRTNFFGHDIRPVHGGLKHFLQT